MPPEAKLTEGIRQARERTRRPGSGRSLEIRFRHKRVRTPSGRVRTRTEISVRGQHRELRRGHPTKTQQRSLAASHTAQALKTTSLGPTFQLVARLKEVRLGLSQVSVSGHNKGFNQTKAEPSKSKNHLGLISLLFSLGKSSKGLATSLKTSSELTKTLSRNHEKAREILSKFSKAGLLRSMIKDFLGRAKETAQEIKNKINQKALDKKAAEKAEQKRLEEKQLKKKVALKLQELRSLVKRFAKLIAAQRVNEAKALLNLIHSQVAELRGLAEVENISLETSDFLAETNLEVAELESQVVELLVNQALRSKKSSPEIASNLAAELKQVSSKNALRVLMAALRQVINQGVEAQVAREVLTKAIQLVAAANVEHAVPALLDTHSVIATTKGQASVVGQAELDREVDQVIVNIIPQLAEAIRPLLSYVATQQLQTNVVSLDAVRSGAQATSASRVIEQLIAQVIGQAATTGRTVVPAGKEAGLSSQILQQILQQLRQRVGTEAKSAAIPTEYDESTALTQIVKASGKTTIEKAQILTIASKLTVLKKELEKAKAENRTKDVAKLEKEITQLKQALTQLVSHVPVFQGSLADVIRTTKSDQTGQVASEGAKGTSRGGQTVSKVDKATAQTERKPQEEKAQLEKKLATIIATIIKSLTTSSDAGAKILAFLKKREKLMAQLSQYNPQELENFVNGLINSLGDNLQDVNDLRLIQALKSAPRPINPANLISQAS